MCSEWPSSHTDIPAVTRSPEWTFVCGRTAVKVRLRPCCSSTVLSCSATPSLGVLPLPQLLFLYDLSTWFSLSLMVICSPVHLLPHCVFLTKFGFLFSWPSFSWLSLWFAHCDLLPDSISPSLRFVLRLTACLNVQCILRHLQVYSWKKKTKKPNIQLWWFVKLWCICEIYYRT